MSVVGSVNIKCGPLDGIDTWTIVLTYDNICLKKNDNVYPCS